MTPCSLVDMYWHFRRIGHMSQQSNSFMLIAEAAQCSECQRLHPPDCMVSHPTRYLSSSTTWKTSEKTHAYTHTHTHARIHIHTHARTRAHTHTHLVPVFNSTTWHEDTWKRADQFHMTSSTWSVPHDLHCGRKGGWTVISTHKVLYFWTITPM